MKELLDQWLSGFVVGFIIRQVEKFKKEVDWEILKADYAERVAALVPGKWFDDEAVRVSDHIIDAAQRALDNTKTQELILNLLVDKKYDEAAEKLRSYLLKSWKTDPELAKEPAYANLDAKAKGLLELNKVKK